MTIPLLEIAAAACFIVAEFHILLKYLDQFDAPRKEDYVLQKRDLQIIVAFCIFTYNMRLLYYIFRHGKNNPWGSVFWADIVVVRYVNKKLRHMEPLNGICLNWKVLIIFYSENCVFWIIRFTIFSCNRRIAV